MNGSLTCEHMNAEKLAIVKYCSLFCTIVTEEGIGFVKLTLGSCAIKLFTVAINSVP